MDIEYVSAALANSETDISKFTNFYAISDIQFESPALIVLEDYYSFLKANSKVVTMDKRYYMRPDYVSYDFYGVTNLGFLILYVNNCMSSIDFTSPEFIVPDEDAVTYVIGKQLIDYDHRVRKLEVY